jgi:hypothetical protein
MVTVCVVVLRYRPNKELTDDPDYKIKMSELQTQRVHFFDAKILKQSNFAHSLETQLNLMIFPSRLCTEETSRIVNIALVLKLVFIIAFCVLLSHAVSFKGYIIFFLILLVLIILLLCIVIALQPQNPTLKTFKVTI